MSRNRTGAKSEQGTEDTAVVVGEIKAEHEIGEVKHERIRREREKGPRGKDKT